MISLAKQIEEHRGAIQHDLLVKTGHEIDDIGRTLSWDALGAFFAYIEPDSALMREIAPDTYRWSSRLKTNMLLADLWDLLAQINANLVAIGSKKPAKSVKPYPRPWKKNPEDERKIGSKGLPPDELHKWFDKKRAEHHARNCSGDHNGHSRHGGGTTDNN